MGCAKGSGEYSEVQRKPRMNPNGRQVHEKVLNITNHQRNANQKHTKISPPTGKNEYHQEDKK